MCCRVTEFIVKYLLFIANLLFAITGLVIIVMGTVLHIQLNNAGGIISALTLFTTGIIVVGCVIFVIAFCACCGAVKESICMLSTYSVFMVILASFKIYMTAVTFSFLSDTIDTVAGWLNSAFNNGDLAPGYQALEASFRCCGTIGATSYTQAGLPISQTCCDGTDMCTTTNSYEGCTTKVANYLDKIGQATGGVLITVIVVECFCILCAIFLALRYRRKN